MFQPTFFSRAGEEGHWGGGEFEDRAAACTGKREVGVGGPTPDCKGAEVRNCNLSPVNEGKTIKLSLNDSTKLLQSHLDLCFQMRFCAAKLLLPQPGVDNIW